MLCRRRNRTHGWKILSRFSQKQQKKWSRVGATEGHSWTVAFAFGGEGSCRESPMWTAGRNNQRRNTAPRKGSNLSKSTVKEHLRLQRAAPGQMLLQVLGLESRQHLFISLPSAELLSQETSCVWEPHLNQGRNRRETRIVANAA